jgi:cytochrome c oxidase subunit 4
MSDHHASSHDTGHAIDVDKHVRGYMIVFASLMALTIVTVGVAYLHLSMPAAITLALIIATVKASLVAAVFMHLIDEKKLIYWVLTCTMAAFVVLLLFPLFGAVDQVGGEDPVGATNRGGAADEAAATH